MAAKPVVAGTDGSEESLQAVEWAAREALLHGAPLRIVSAAELLPRMSRQQSGTHVATVSDVLRQNRDRALEAAVRRAAGVSEDLTVETGQLSGPMALAVTDSGSGALMLVLGSRGIGAFAAMILGSVSRYAATHASCPVVVVRDATGPVHGKIGVGIRDLDNSAGLLNFAFEEATLRQASLTVLYSWHAPHLRMPPGDDSRPAPALSEEGMVPEIADALATWREKYPGVQVTEDVVEVHPGRARAG